MWSKMAKYVMKIAKYVIVKNQNLATICIHVLMQPIVPNCHFSTWKLFKSQIFQHISKFFGVAHHSKVIRSLQDKFDHFYQSDPKFVEIFQYIRIQIWGRIDGNCSSNVSKCSQIVKIHRALTQNCRNMWYICEKSKICNFAEKNRQNMRKIFST